MVEVRLDSWIYVLDTSKQKEKIRNKIVEIGYAPLELVEARKEIESTNAAIAAQRIDSKILKNIEKEIVKMMKEDLNGSDSDREFHLLVAKATGNRVLEDITDYLWQQQQDSPMWM